MKLTVVGCSGSFPGPDSPASCYLVEAEHEGRTWRILLDLGNGSLGALHRYADPLSIDGVFLSHLHADHCMDLCGYYVMRKYHPNGPQPQLPVWGPGGTAERMARAYDLPKVPGMTGEFRFRGYSRPVELGPFLVEAVRVKHPVTSYALRVTAQGRTLVYSGDTAPCRGLDRAAQGADLLLIEASFRVGHRDPEGIHLTGRDAGRTATRAKVARVVLTHIPPWHEPLRAFDEAQTSWDGPLDLAVAGATYWLGEDPRPS